MDGGNSARTFVAIARLFWLRFLVVLDIDKAFMEGTMKDGVLPPGKHLSCHQHLPALVRAASGQGEYVTRAQHMLTHATPQEGKKYR